MDDFHGLPKILIEVSDSLCEMLCKDHVWSFDCRMIGAQNSMKFTP